MDEQRVISSDELVQRMRSNLERALQAVAAAVNQAESGRVIAASEYPVRDAMDRLKREVYQEALQMRSEAEESAFSPSRQGLGSPLASQRL